MSCTKRRGAPPLLVLACLAGLGCGGQDDTRPAEWSYISTSIVQPSCATANCHSILSERSGVRLDGIDIGYKELVGRHFVVEGRPDSSSLVALLKGQGARRMPPDFALPTVDIDLITKWIINGAPRRGLGAPVDLDAGGAD